MVNKKPSPPWNIEDDSRSQEGGASRFAHELCDKGSYQIILSEK